jgi:hypothetical protein
VDLQNVAAVKERMPLSSTLFFERVRKADDLRLIEVYQWPGRGRTREIMFRYDAKRVAEVCG